MTDWIGVDDMEITEFLLARIAEDEAQFHARAEHEADRCRLDGMPDTTREEVEEYWLRREDGASVTEWPRWLAECEAKRRIVEQCQMVIDSFGDWDATPGSTPLWHNVSRRERSQAHARLYTLAAIYADHPDYREEWRP